VPEIVAPDPGNAATVTRQVNHVTYSCVLRLHLTGLVREGEVVGTALPQGGRCQGPMSGPAPFLRLSGQGDDSRRSSDILGTR
jgi:hypothetical protein